MARRKADRRTVGLRELKNGLSAYVRRAQAGETITVTDRGKPIVEIRAAPTQPLSEEEIERRLDAMAAAGLLRRGRPADLSWLTRTRKPLVPPGTTQRWLDELREDRF